MKKLMITALTICLALTVAGGGVIYASATTESEKPHIKATSAVLMDYDSGTVVFTQNEREHLPIASMVKIMTLLLTFEEIDAGRLSTEETVRVSEYASSMGGSQAYLDANCDYVVNELIKSIVVGSANDSCVALAERIAGSVEAFVVKMNEKAKSLGMLDTNFINCTGLPGLEQYSCAADVAVMSRALYSHPAFFDYSKVWMFDFTHPSGRITQLSNTNKLLRAYEGCDGGKTGFTNEAKYCLSATAKRGNTRLISVVCGAESSKVRNAQNATLFNYGFANYESKQVVVGGNPIEGELEVKGGKQKTVCAYPEKDCYIFCKRGEESDVEITVEKFELKAPVNKGDIVGTLKVTRDGETVESVNLLSDSAVKKATYLDVVDDFIEKW